MTLPLDRVPAGRPVLPVLVIEDVALAPDLARALYAGGVTVLEVIAAHAAGATRSPPSIARCPRSCWGRVPDPHRAVSRGATEAHSSPSAPDARRDLPPPREDAGLPYLPGVMTPSEVLLALEYGYRSLKRSRPMALPA